MAPTRDEHEREIATAEAAAIGCSKTFRFRSVEERGASGRTYPGSKLESKSVEACSLSRQAQFPSYVLEGVQPLRRTCDSCTNLACLLGLRRCRFAPNRTQRSMTYQ
ncbi:hypothetical protein V8C40DRAFT_228985 [Trichoderma camerunense]